MPRRVAFLLLVLGWMFTGGSAVAAPRDKAAQKKIEEAIYTNFLNTDFDAAEGLLLGTIRACEDKCSPELIAKTWMYVGVVRGSGRSDLAGATEAFKAALGIDANVALDNEIATEQVKAAFAKLKTAPAAIPPPAEAPGARGTLTCVPSPTEVETRRPVPLQCDSDKDLAGATLFYKSFNGGWASATMELHDGAWRGTIPCSVTQNTGKLHYYVLGLDDEKKVVVSLGDKDKPKAVDIVSETTADPPAFPEEQPPARCDLGDSPPTTPPAGNGECVAYGVSCKGGGTCCEGMACIEGTCGEAECKGDSDCKDGAECKAGACGDPKAGAANYAKNYVGVHFAFDIASLSTNSACTPESRNDKIACFNGDGTTYEGTPVRAGGAGKTSGLFAPATLRALVSYERLFGPFGLEGRAGFAFNGGQTPQGASAFLPVHLEVRAKYWLLGTKAFSKPGFRPWVHVGGGLAQVDATVSVPIADCPTLAPECTNAKSIAEAGALPRASDRPVLLKVKATERLGQTFVTFGGGVMYAVAKNHGVLLNLNLMVPFPSTGFVIEPSLGYAYGF